MYSCVYEVDNKSENTFVFHIVGSEFCYAVSSACLGFKSVELSVGMCYWLIVIWVALHEIPLPYNSPSFAGIT